MITPRKRAIIVVLIIIAILLFVVWLLSSLFTKDPEVAYEEPVTQTTQPIKTEETISEKLLQQEQEVRDQSSGVISISKTFVERYGSYSNESNFANIKDVLPIMTTSFAKKSQEFIDGSTAPKEVYGVTTRVITVKVDSIDEEVGTAKVLITTQKEESVESSVESLVRYQDIELNLLKEAGVWKIDSATWL